jgi:UDP-N-acetylglucosamine 4,6-dehydratase
MNSSLNNSSLLITGGTGSFGNAVLDKFLQSDIGEVKIFSRDEKKQDDMRHRYNSSKLSFVIGDVRDFSSINSAMRGVDFVFSAAALKQVPSCEFYPLEAVNTNIHGTANTIEAAVNNGIKKIVVLSTDKAVYPVNAMGMSKAIMEKVMVAKSRNISNTILCGTRYGNVMASRGSVIPLFVKQIKNREPLTLTNSQMTRFMMSLEDAVGLVEFAFHNSKQGDIFVQKSPACTIELLAEVLIEIFESKSEVICMGSRHGEKFYETLLSKEESAVAEDLGSYFRIPSDFRDLNYQSFLEKSKIEIDSFKDYSSNNTYMLGREELKELLLKLPFIQEELIRL